MAPNKRDNREKESAAVPRMLSRHLETVALGISCISFVMSLAAIAITWSRISGVRDPLSVVSALSSLAVVGVALVALGQWKNQLRTRNIQSAATEVLERAYENQELYNEISPHVGQVLMNKTYRRQLAESTVVLQQQREVMLDYTDRVMTVSSRLDAALYKASIVCGSKIPLDPNTLVSMESTVVWSWMTSAFIRAQAFPEGSEDRVSFLDSELTKVKEALDKAPETMREKREELRKILAPFFEV